MTELSSNSTQSPSDLLHIVSSCAYSLETPLKNELKRLDFVPQVLAPGQVLFRGNWADVVRANLWLRVADRIQIQLNEFSASDFDALFEQIREMDWGRWLPVDAQFPVIARSRKSQLTSVPAVQRSTKRAIVEALYRDHGVTELPETGARYRVETVLSEDHARILIDTTGPSLHKRGYRHLVGPAPIKETLAAAMIELSVWRPDRPLIDPFCGSGTIPIEAALIGMNIAPGLRRGFDCESWPQIGDHIWSENRLSAEQSIDTDIQLQIIGTDIDERSLDLARRHADRAGVAHQIHFQQKAFEDLRSKKKYGCIITNPPYGERLDEKRRLQPLYRSIPQVLQRLPTWSHFILTSMNRFENTIQKKATRRRKLYNGRIECQYYQFLGPRPPRLSPGLDNDRGDKAALDESGASSGETDSESSNPVFGGITEKANEQADLFAARLKKRARHFRRWPTRRGITCYRLYERDIPELPFVVDIYEDHIHMIEYDRPHDRNLGQHASWLELMKKTTAAALDVPIHKVHLKSRIRQSGLSQHEKQGQRNSLLTVREGGLKFLVNLDDYADTGLFLDHRITRQMVREEAANKRFLNLFAYTGSFTVYAADGGAQETWTVDWSNTYLEWAHKNLVLNQFDQPDHHLVRHSASKFVAEARCGPLRWDLVVVDPPTFSNSKRTDKIWDVQKEYLPLLTDLSEVVTTGGIVFFSTNFRRFKMDETGLPQYNVVDISRQTVPEDFRNRRIHQCWKLVKR